MNKTTLYWIIGLMGLSLIGLISFQLQWIYTAIEANEERFEKDVLEAMKQVAVTLEEQEAVYTVFNQLHPSGHNRVHFSSPQKLSELWELDNLDTLIDDKNFNFQFDISENGFGFSVDNKVFISEGNDEQVFVLNEKKRLETEKLKMKEKLEQIEQKSELVADVVFELLSDNRLLTNRFNPVQLDSLLERELTERGITIPFEFGVVSPAQNRFVALKKVGSEERLLKSPLRASLFPNDIFGDQAFLILNFQNTTPYLLGQLWFTLSSSAILALIITFCFGYAVFTILRQKKVSEMKNDFINNMTHELKTPIATVGLAVEALQDKEIGSIPSFQDRYLKVIDEENKRLGQQVEKVLHMATLDKQELQLKEETVHMHEVIETAIENIAIQIENRSGSIKSFLEALNDQVIGDQTHLINVIINLLENANKYSSDSPRIILRSENRRKFFILSIQDHGIGMTKDSIRNIFHNFYRIPKGNLHDVKGFGLGLAYVKTIVELHHGQIEADSEIGKGSKFTISLPMYHGKT